MCKRASESPSKSMSRQELYILHVDLSNQIISYINSTTCLLSSSKNCSHVALCRAFCTMVLHFNIRLHILCCRAIIIIILLQSNHNNNNYYYSQFHCSIWLTKWFIFIAIKLGWQTITGHTATVINSNKTGNTKFKHSTNTQYKLL